MDQEQVIEIAKAYSEKVRIHMDIKKVVLFGSYAKGNSRPESDIDIAVIVDEIPGDYLSLAANLFKFTRNVDDRIEPILLEEGDDPSGFLDEVVKTGHVIYDFNQLDL